MPPDPAKTAETREWLAKARHDLRAAEVDFTADPPLTADIAFHCQQLAEKSLKGFLAWHDRPFRKTHNPVEIGEECVGIDDSLEPLPGRVAPLTAYAWHFRYPGTPAEPTEEEARAALALAREVYDAICSRLPDDVTG